MSKKPRYKILVDKTVLLEVLRELEGIVVSFDRIGASGISVSDDRVVKFIAEFVTKWNVAPRLSHCRTVLSECFSTQAGPDGMTELEREMEDVPNWSLTSQDPPEEIATYHLKKRR